MPLGDRQGTDLSYSPLAQAASPNKTVTVTLSDDSLADRQETF